MDPPSLSILVPKNIEAQWSQVSQFLPLDNNVAREFDYGLNHIGIEGQNTE